MRHVRIKQVRDSMLKSATCRVGLSVSSSAARPAARTRALCLADASLGTVVVLANQTSQRRRAADLDSQYQEVRQRVRSVQSFYRCAPRGVFGFYDVDEDAGALCRFRVARVPNHLAADLNS